jgi:4-hydroxybenzoate polyprenyltransferase
MNPDRIKVFTGSANPSLAEEICQQLGLDLGMMRLKRFSDGEINLQILENVRGADCFVVQPTCSPGDPHLMELLEIIYTLRLSSAERGAFIAVTYPFVKRFLSVPQLYLGLAFGAGIPMAFAAQLEYVPRIAWLLLLANVLWVTVYDTMYAMVDRDDDIRIGVKSTAILFGDSDRHIIAVLQVMTLVTLYLVGKIIRAGAWYNAGLAAGAMFFIYQLWLIRARDREGCFRAFLNNNYFGMSVFIGLALEYQFAR